MSKYFAESELIINEDGSVFHLHLKPEHLADKVILVGDPGRVALVASHFDSIEDEVENMVEQFKANLSYQGLTLEQYCGFMNTDVNGFKTNLKPEAEKNVKMKLALEAVAKVEDIKVEDKEIDEKIDELKKQYGSADTSDDLNKNENVRRYMEDKIRQDKLMKIIVDAAIEK